MFLATHHKGLSKSEVGEEDVLLQHVANLPLEVLVERVAVQEDVPGVRPQSTREHVQQRRLSGPWRDRARYFLVTWVSWVDVGPPGSSVNGITLEGLLIAFPYVHTYNA